MRIKFLRHANQYNAGEMADFDEPEATRLVQHEYAEFVAPVDGMIDDAPVDKGTLLAAASGISPMPYKKAPRFAALGPDLTDEERHEQDARNKKEGNRENVIFAAHDAGSSQGPRTDGGDEARLRLRTPVPVLNEAEAAKAAEVRAAEAKAAEAEKRKEHKEAVADDDDENSADLPGRGTKPHRRK